MPAIVDAVAPIPVLAAGGIADGRGLAAALMLGAAGVLVGTRFFASHEALGHPAAKQRLVEGKGDETLRTTIFDTVRKIDWPHPYTGRALANDFSRRWHGREETLADAIEAALPAWVTGCVERTFRAWIGKFPADVAQEARQAGMAAQHEIGPEIRRLLEADIDAQQTTPLAVLRTAVRYPTAVLRSAGVPPVGRDRFAEEAFPDDVYGLSPASLADLATVPAWSARAQAVLASLPDDVADYKGLRDLRPLILGCLSSLSPIR